MDASMVLREICESVETRDGRRLAALFCEDGVYHDVFYGAFAGRQRIAQMVDKFYETADEFRWQMVDPVSDGRTVYARYLFSYRSRLQEAQGRRVLFEGVSVLKMRDGKIEEYREVANAAPGFVDMGFPPQRIARIVARQGEELRKRPETAPHLG